MKKIRLFLSIAAFAIALGVTAYSELMARPNVVNVDGYEFIQATVEEPAMCKRWENVCNPEGRTACTISGVSSILREHSDETTTPPCGQELTKLP